MYKLLLKKKKTKNKIKFWDEKPLTVAGTQVKQNFCSELKDKKDNSKKPASQNL